MSTDIAQLIAYHRNRSGLTQQELATLAEVGKNLIYELEKGKRTVRLENLLKVLRVLNIEIDFRSPLMAAFQREHADEKRSILRRATRLPYYAGQAGTLYFLGIPFVFRRTSSGGNAT